MTRKLALLAFASLLAPGAFAQRGSGAVLGALGQAMDQVSIFAAPTARSRVYYRVRAYDYLVVRKSRTKSWFMVLMQNGAYGYVDSQKVVQLPYEVRSQGSSRQQSLSSRTGSSIAQYSTHFVGTPYKWGGNDLNNGIDCSGFVKKMFGQIGVSLPRTASEQAMVGQPIGRLEDLIAGDRLYFWDSRRGKIGHTGIYLGNGYFVHSSSGRGGVATDYLGETKWRKILVAARR
ncbi:MAG: C40 family peptidase [Fimbriimonas sp.]